MLNQKKLTQAIRNIIVEMGEAIEIPENTVHYILTILVIKGFNETIASFGEDSCKLIIAKELENVCEKLLYQSAVEHVIALGLSEFFTTNNTTIGKAVRLYADFHHINGSIDVVLNHVIIGIVEPVIEKNQQMSLREAIISVSQNDTNKLSKNYYNKRH